ncbi:MAG: glycosyltransferase 87 family protein [Jatrophihabitantaceae bacterium]
MPWRRALLTLAVWMMCSLVGYFAWFFLNNGVHGLDSHAYWLSGHRAVLYGTPPGSRDAYLYSPAFAMLIGTIAQLPWIGFLSVWTVAESAAFVWLLAPLGWRWGPPMFFLCMIEIVVGNIYGFLAVVAVVGARRPAAWALPLLTKFTLGLGPVWFATRREWRSLAWSLGATIIIAGTSFLLAPNLWFEWVRFLLANKSGSEWLLPLRLVGAVALTVFGARSSRPWLVAPAMLLATPLVTTGWMSLSILAAIPRLRRDHGRHDPSLVTAREQ